jgi:hypothetical protein
MDSPLVVVYLSCLRPPTVARTFLIDMSFERIAHYRLRMISNIPGVLVQSLDLTANMMHLVMLWLAKDDQDD